MVAGKDRVLLLSGLSAVQGAGILTTGSTVFFFSHGGRKVGERVLVRGGRALEALPSSSPPMAGANVTAMASGDGVAFVREPGAQEVVDHRAHDLAAEVEDIDLVLDLVDGQTRSRSYAVLPKEGRLVCVVALLDEAEASATA